MWRDTMKRRTQDNIMAFVAGILFFVCIYRFWVLLT